MLEYQNREEAILRHKEAIDFFVKNERAVGNSVDSNDLFNQEQLEQMIEEQLAEYLSSWYEETIIKIGNNTYEYNEEKERVVLKNC
jgi:hypothetical protein